MALARSLAFSILASVLATVALRRILSVSEGPRGREGGASPNTAVVVVVPVLVGNSNNRVGWVKEVHHHYRSLFGRADRQV